MGHPLGSSLDEFTKAGMGQHSLCIYIPSVRRCRAQRLTGINLACTEVACSKLVLGTFIPKMSVRFKERERDC